MNHMNPDQFQNLLTRAVEHGPTDAELLRPLGRDVAAGERLLRRRRRRVAAATSACVVAATATVSLYAATGGEPGSRNAPVASDAPPSSTAQILDACRKADGGKTIFDSGEPTIEGRAHTTFQDVVALQAADKTSWAECGVYRTPQEFPAWMETWSTTGTTTELSHSSGPGCALVDGQVDTTCTTFQLSYVDRLPADVAAVEFTTGDGKTTQVDTHHGYVVFNYLAPLPDGVHVADVQAAPEEYSTWTNGFTELHQVTYLDREGNPIASQMLDGTGAGQDGEAVDNLPLLKAYPSLRGNSAKVAARSSSN